TALDYAEIQQLYIRYNWGIDTHADNGMVWAKTFTQDGEFILNGGKQKYVGREQLAAFAKAKPGFVPDGPHHFATNIRIDASPEGARGGRDFGNVPTPAADKPSMITGTGTYEDVLVKTAEGWRFKTRTFHANALPPSAIAASSN